jgi:UDP:flavonoid glycosyltransferase YjiC (YdhE family)
MRILMTTTRGAGHFGPLRPFADAFRADGHEVLVAVPESAVEMVRRAGHEPWPLPEAAPDERDALFARTRGASHDEANAIVVGELFAGVDARAALPGILAAVAERLPDVIVHESCEFAGALAAERAGLPSIRVAIGIEELERYMAAFAALAVDRLRAEHGLEPDPDGARLRAEPSLTLTPPALDGHRPAARYREPAPAVAPPPGGASDDSRPLVYLSLGTVAPASGFYPGLYRAAIEQLADLDVRVLLNTGRQDPTALGPLPAGVHAQRWVHEAGVLPHAAAMVSHGGAGSIRTALAAGVPLAVLPLFGDQPYNAQAVAAIGAGVALEGVEGVRDGARTLLEDPRYARTAAAVAAEVAALPPAGEAIELLRAELAAFAI